MDRYWISRDIHKANKVAIPTEEDLKKYSKSEEYKKPEKDIFQQKAELCAEIIKIQNPEGIDEKEFAR